MGHIVERSTGIRRQPPGPSAITVRGSGKRDGRLCGVSIPLRQIRAVYDESSITVYQAYRPEIAEPALANGRFGPSFSRDRMTWIKPSFLWMAYRCGWASKSGQEKVLSIRISRTGFDWALQHAALSHFDRRIHADEAAWKASLLQPVRIQWDPERDLRHNALDHRAIQIGLSDEASRRYCDEWILGIEDATPLMREISALVRSGGPGPVVDGLLPHELPYPVAPELAELIGASPS